MGELWRSPPWQMGFKCGRCDDSLHSELQEAGPQQQADSLSTTTMAVRSRPVSRWP